MKEKRIQFRAEIMEDAFTITPTLGVLWDYREIEIVFSWLIFGALIVIKRKRKGI